ncbi:MAG: phage integrase family protein [Lautropia sp.]
MGRKGGAAGPAQGKQVTREAGQRRIDAAQFAFVRAVVLGIPMREAADRYLGEGLDLRVVQSELRWLRTELLAAARRGGVPGDVRAPQLDIAQIPTSLREAPPAVPSLEQFRERVDPDGFYGEAELLALYKQQHATPDGGRRVARLARLRERQRRALDAIERILVFPPSLDDPPSAWLEPATARRIEAVGLSTLVKLADWIRQRGQRWWTVVPRVGEVAAGRVVDWLRRNADALGIRFDASVTMSRRELVARWRAVPQLSGVLAPLDRLFVPADLDGSRGTNRLPGLSRLGAANDREAIEAWIEARAGSNANTQRAYRREAERLLIWAIFERRKPVSSLTVEDAIAFRVFLRDPQPAVGGWGRGGRLGCRQTGGRSMGHCRRAASRMRSRSTGLRLSELADARIGRLTVQADESTEIDQTEVDAPAKADEEGSLHGRRVLLRVLGKGGKLRTVPIVPQVEQLIDATLAARGLSDWVLCQREGLNGVRLLGPLGGRRPVEKGLSHTMVYKIVKGAFGQCEELSRKRGMDRDAEVFASASTHWLRHTFGRHAMAHDVKPNVVQAVLGHASLATTTRYSSEDGKAAWDAVRAFSRKRV